MFFRNIPTHTWHNYFLYLYLLVLALSGFIGGVAFCFTPKIDTTAVAFLACFDSVIGMIYITSADMGKESNLPNHTASADQSNITLSVKTAAARAAPSQGNFLYRDSSGQRSKSRKCRSDGLRISNRILMILHSLLFLLSVAGAIELAMAYRYNNP
jgi:hypothetical protein